jgi:hypothetical protein
MKVSIPVTCSCGIEFLADGYAGKKFPVSTCPKCNTTIHIIEHLSISVVADLLLYRSKTEMEGGDYTLSIICSSMAVECALTQVFLKWRKIESRIYLPSEDEQNAWEEELRKKGSIKKSVDFVSEFLSGMKFDDFVTDFLAKNKDHPGILIKNGFPQWASQTELDYFQKEIFDKRNRIMHWGKVDYQMEEAALCLSAAIVVVNILKLMDRLKCEKMEHDWRQANP